MNKPEPNYMPQLDSLRALAIFAVMIHHWAPGLLGFGPWGDLGVRCFFVLSGFLITGILLRARAAVDGGRSSAGWQFRQFYIRRSLRIFPIYYLTLAVGSFLGIYVLRQSLWWHAFYTSNFYFAFRGTWQGCISHLWSLSVEEQFYLLWPAMMLLLPRAWLPRVFAICIGGAVAARAILAATLGVGHISLKVVSLCCLDSLVTGALLAWLCSPAGRAVVASPPELLKRAFPAAALLFAIQCTLDYFLIAIPARAIVGPLIDAAFFATVVGLCAHGCTGPAGRLLDSRVLQYFGRISYGLYLYHLFADYVAGMFATKFKFTLPEAGAAKFALLFAMSVAAAAFSARFIERPMNNLKRFFPSEKARNEGPCPAPLPGNAPAAS